MTRTSDKRPPRAASPGIGRTTDKPGQASPNGETIGRFVGNLARLEGRAGQGRKDKEGSR